MQDEAVSDARAVELAQEREWVHAARKGDRRAFAALYNLHARAIYAQVLFPLLGESGAAEDALAETFRTAFQRLDSFEYQGTSIFHWLSRIARNKALDMHRARNVTRRALANLAKLVDPTQHAEHSPERLLSNEIEHRNLKRRIATALQQLNPRYKSAIELRFFEEHSREECALRLEVKVATFDVLLLRSLRAFRKLWDDAKAEVDYG